MSAANESMPPMGYVHSVETFGLVDGPGVRYVLFLQGCRMRCKYCHNPETWAFSQENAQTPQQAFDDAYRYHNYWKNNGGLTVSGGEPLLQIDFLTELFRLAKARGVHTTLDTCGQPFTTEEPFYSKFCKLMEYTDLVMLDIKEWDSEKHRQLTGHPNGNILEMARWLSDHGKDMWVRHVLVPGLTDEEDALREIRGFLDSLKTVRRVEILPYHTLGLFKWDNLGIDYPLAGVPTPTDEQVRRAEELLGIPHPDET